MLIEYSGFSVPSWEGITSWFLLVGDVLEHELKLIEGHSLHSLNDPARKGMLFVTAVVRIVHLQQLHDLSTRELAIRFGGTKTGLLNASMVRGTWDFLFNR
ncbi:hypothetical protein JVT61DRAFT_6490 [Boletus reticuloceps]|uniref:Uncharacterized protein n=1 Tax=Boletus reticuloceps TaxID=495285 RepID=A0A8I2YK03_9AGAM|nr:hypothetical protein JVT61DRAFT_6490 [Boletus reticuloceps]